MRVDSYISDVQREDFNNLIDDYSESLSEFRGKSVLITGATGLIGKTLMLFFLYLNDSMDLEVSLTVSVRNLDKFRAMVNKLINRSELKILVQDIADDYAVNYDVDFIFHTAAVTQSKALIEFPADIYTKQFLGMRNILNLARQKGASMVYLSSMEIYGQPFLSDKRTSENDVGYVNPLVIRNGYPESKRSNEFMMAAYASEYNVQVVSGRLAQTFGAGTSRDDSRAFAQFSRSALNGENITLYTDGTSVGNYTYLGDTLSALIVLAVRGVAGEAYNIVNESATSTIREVANLVSTRFGNGKVSIVNPDHDLGFAPKVNLKMSATKIRQLGWTPRVELGAMFERMIKDWNLKR